MRTRALARGGAAGVATLLVERSAGLLLVVVLARTLSAEAYGRYSFAIAYLTIFQVLADLGLEPVLVQRLAREPELRAPTLAAGLGLRLLLTGASGLAAVGLAPWVAGRADVVPLIAIAAPALLFAAQPGVRALLRSELRLGDVLRVAAFASASTFSLAAVALAARTGAEGVFAAIALSQIASFGLAAHRARDLAPLGLAVDPPLWRRLLADAWPVGGNLLVVLVGLRAAPLLLMRARGPVEVGLFASAARLTEALNIFADGVLLAVFPVLARLAVAHRGEMRALARVTARLFAVAFLSIALFVSQVPGELMGIVYGPAFARAGPVLAVLAANAVLSALGTLYVQVLIAVGRQRSLFLLNVFVSLGQVGLQLLLVPRFGLLGAAAGVLAAALASHTALASLPEAGAEVRACLRGLLAPGVTAAALLGLAPWLPLGAAARAVALPTLLLAASLALFARADLASLRAALAGGRSG